LFLVFVDKMEILTVIYQLSVIILAKENYIDSFPVKTYYYTVHLICYL